MTWTNENLPRSSVALNSKLQHTDLHKLLTGGATDHQATTSIPSKTGPPNHTFIHVRLLYTHAELPWTIPPAWLHWKTSPSPHSTPVPLASRKTWWQWCQRRSRWYTESVRTKLPIPILSPFLTPLPLLDFWVGSQGPNSCPSAAPLMAQRCGVSTSLGWWIHSMWS